MTRKYRHPVVVNGSVKRGTRELLKTLESVSGVYDVVRIVEGVPLFLEEHLFRLRRSAELSEASFVPPSREEFEMSVDKLIREHGPGPYSIKLSVGEGREGSYYLAPVPRRTPRKRDYLKGVSTRLVHLARHHPEVKVIDSSYSTRIQREIAEEHVFEVLLVDEKERITEGSKSNIFFVRNNTLITPPRREVLPGITRSKILHLAASQNIPVREEEIFTHDLGVFDAVFLTGTSIFVLPVARIDGTEYPSTSSTVVKNMMDAYHNLVREYIRTFGQRNRRNSHD